MKPLTGDQQLRSLSLSYCVALQALNQNPLHEEEGAWMQAPIEASRRGVGEVFSLDILSHRMSVIAFHEKAGRSQVDSLWFLLDTMFLLQPSGHCRHPSIRTLDERFVSLGASWVFSFQPVLPPVYRPLVLLLKMEAGPGD